MVATESQKPVCPVCHQADQVQTLQEAYESGNERFAPPPVPQGRAPMMRTMAIGVLLVTLCSFFIIVLLVPANLPDWAKWLQAVVTIIIILAVLVASFFAFQRIVQGDLQSQSLLPAWDNAMANWNRLRYCKRDNIVFDPQQIPSKPLTDEAVKSMLSVEAPSEPVDITTPRIAQHPSH